TGSQGSMTMTAGTIITGAEFDVGVGGATGVFNQSGGTITLNHNGANAWVIIGQSGGNGTYNLSGGSITAADRFYVGVNANTQSLMNMTGGTVVAGAEFDIGVGGATGVLNQSAGNITVNHNGANAWNIVGQSGGNGTYNMSGGSATFADRAVIGTDGGTQGVLNLSGNAVYR